MEAGQLTTSLELLDSGARFGAKTANPLYQQQLVQAGFQDAADELFVRYVDRPPDVEEIYENFSRHIEEILLQHAGVKPVPWESALRDFLRQVQGAELKWWLSGSAALAVRGVDIAPRDLDFAVSDPHSLGLLLQDALVEPVTRMRDWVAEWFGRAFLGALVEWVSDVRSPIIDDHGLEQGAEAASRLELVPWEDFIVPVAPLDLQLVVAERRGQSDRAEKIRHLLN